MASKIYLVQGGMTPSENSDFDFFIITYDFKENFGYIGKKGKNFWKLYTILGRSPMVLGSPENHYYFKTFEDCAERLKTLSGSEVEIRYIDSQDDSIEESADIRSVAGGSMHVSERT